MSGSGVYISTLKWFLHSTSVIWKIVAIYFKIFFPDYHSLYGQAFEAGRWEESDVGPFLGQAVVYKLDVTGHFDKKDGGPVVSFPCGLFEGGSMSLPQLSLKLRYV